jgi:glycosyltransferase involved in cell wall biosynthesis
MNLLVISNNPDRASFRQRIGIYIDSLQSAGINCRVEKLPSDYLSRWRLFANARDFDGVFLHKKCLNFFDARILRKHAKKLIYDFDDAVMYSPRAPQSDRTSHYRLFRRTATMADVVIAGNSYLAEHAVRFNNNVHILPTGLDIGRYNIDVQKQVDGKVRLVWIGSKSTLKYLSLIKPVLKEVGSQFSQAVLRIICDDFLDFKNIEVEKCNWSRQIEVTELKQCDIGLAPLPDNRFARGKCGFKILQYAAAGLPAVVSSTGVNYEYVQERVTGFLVSDTRQWYKRIAELIEEPDLRKQMGCKAGEHVKQFDSKIIGERLVSLIRD